MIAKSKITRIFIFEVYWLSTKSSKFFILENKSPYGILVMKSVKLPSDNYSRVACRKTKKFLVPVTATADFGPGNCQKKLWKPTAMFQLGVG